MHTINLSSEDKISLFFKGDYTIFSLFFFGIGSLLLLGFLSVSDFTSVNYFFRDLGSTKAIITKIDETNSKSNDRPVLEYRYQFLDSIKGQEGNSYSSTSNVQINDTVMIEYVLAKPEISRIYGMRNAPFGLSILVFLIIFPGVGLFFLVKELKLLSQKLMILEDYSVANGTLASKVTDQDDDEGLPRYRIRYSYTFQNQTYNNISYSHSPDKFMNEEMLICSRPSPNLSILLKKLPEKIRDKVKQSIMPNLS